MALFPLSVKVELFINGSWTDISRYVYQRDTIQITGGRSAQADTPNPAQATVTVNNRDGRFSPLYTGGAYYPYLKRNVRIRISVSGTSSSSNVYSGYRFWGEVSEWPPLSDISAKDVYVQIIASGPLRRIRRHGGRGSALTRYYAQLTGLAAPIAYWPCEEDPDTSLVGAGVEGGTNMTITTGSPKWKAISDFNGSHPIGVLNNSTWLGTTGAFGSSGDDVFVTPGTYTWIATTTTVDARCWGGGGGGGDGTPSLGAGAGGGGEFAQEAALAVTPGTSYTVVVGSGGAGGSTPAGDGTDSTMAGNSVTVTGNGGQGAQINGAGGAAGTGSANTVHHNGGAGGTRTGSVNGGAGGGGSGGTAAAGNAGANSVGGSGAAGGAAVTGGGKGGNGGDGGGGGAANGHAGSGPGGGGGGAGQGAGGGGNGANGAAGKVELIYTSSGGGTLPSNNVTRFIMFVPVHGGNAGRVLVRTATTGTIARLDVIYVGGGSLRLKGYDSGAALLFTSADLSVGNGQTLMVSAEMAPSGANIAWKLLAIKPGDSAVIGTVSGTQNTATIGSVTSVTVAPDADITKTAIGHVSVQYSLVPLTRVSKALHGHHTEMGIDRFIRLANEQAMDNAVEFSEAADHWGFEASTQSWVGTNCALTSSAVTVTGIGGDTIFAGWPPEGAKSLLMTANGAGQPVATSPTGTSGQPVNVGDTVSVNAELYAPVTHNNVFVGIMWYQSGGSACAHAEDDSADAVLTGGTMATLKVKAVAPATAAFFAVKVGNHNVDANNTLLYCDNVRTHPRMGPQTTNDYHHFLREIEDLDQGILKEARELFGMKYRTRIRLINQAVALTLDYSAGTVSPPLAPVLDDKQTKNDITVHRHKGSSIRVTLDSGDMSIQEPPVGSGRHKRQLRIAAEEDQQLAALAAHLLSLGTAADERYPTITVNLGRAGIASNAVAPLMSAVAGVEIGDRVQVTNLPFWYPSATADQMVIGYTETVNAYEWTITWNCVPFSPYVQVASTLRRW